MNEILWVVPAAPFGGFLLLSLAGGRLSRAATAGIGVGSVGLSMLAAFLTWCSFIIAPPRAHAYVQVLWSWMDVAGFSPGITFYLDALALVMVLVITVVGFLIHLYSAGFMRYEDGYRRFFAYMNLFVGSMLTLVLADNLLLLYLGWEGVGICSYLLIGFWYKNEANGYAARKAFVVTRVGDTAFALGIFLLFSNLGTLQIQELMVRAGQQWAPGSALAVAAAALILGGAVGKSAQLPLQTWLPDAMAGPSPVSALIHAATMVTAGVYLIARTHVLFTLAPEVQTAVAVIGAATLLLAGFSALVQTDIKRVLAYSTISQIGYMFLALGVGAWSAAIFHFMTHAFFKALLFLAAGIVIIRLDDEHNMFKMGGLRVQLPLVFWTFIVGALSLSALPLVTAGFYSKDLILWDVWSSKEGSPWLWAAGLAGALLTSIYTFRMVFLTFFGEGKTIVSGKTCMLMSVPVVILAVLSAAGGFLELPLTGFLKTVLPQVQTAGSMSGESVLKVMTGMTSVAGIVLAWFLFLRAPGYIRKFSEARSGTLVHRLWLSGWGFDRLYDTFIVRPFVLAAKVNRDDFIDFICLGVIWTCRGINRFLTLTQAGKLRWYAAGLAMGAIALLGFVVFS
ncbi:MAG TPA: NADH-quinone oxidoreductase subunit L [Dissulfurispiraceae bacterium]|nr:NADH-quinone oxidoreductase subunit L [Dissulfurispiraceae bacterium]